MQLRECGKSGLRLSALGIGCWSFGGAETDYWGSQDQNDAEEVVRCAVDLGINYFDTAEAYNSGRSETALGRAIRGVPRDLVVIGTKLSPSNAFPGKVTEHCEASLSRLGTDYIDVYMVHWPLTLKGIQQFDRSITTPPAADDVFAELRKLQDQGEDPPASASATSGGSDWTRCCARARPSRSTSFHTAWCPARSSGRSFRRAPSAGSASSGTWPFSKDCSAIGTPRLMISPCYAVEPDTSITAGCPRRATANTERKACSRRRCRESIRLPGHFIRRCRSSLWPGASLRPSMTCTLAGARNARQLKENADAFAAPLPADVIGRLDEITRPLKEKMGSSLDYWESEANDRTA